MNESSIRAYVTYGIASLRYYLLEGPTPLEPLRILEKRELNWSGWQVSMFALGASHAVRLERDGRQIVELLSCAPAAPPSTVLEQDTAQRAWKIARELPGLRYKCLLTPFSLREPSGLRGQFAQADRLEVAFPPSAGLATPVTCVGWRDEGWSLAVETVHTYPEEERGVRTESLFQAIPLQS